MKVPKVANALNYLDDDLISEAIEYKPKKKKPVWVKWGAMAACLCLMVVAAVTLFPQNGVVPPIDGTPSNVGDNSNAAPNNNNPVDGGGGTLSTNPDDNTEVEFSIFAYTDIVSAIKNDIPEVSDSWTDADNPVINYEHIVSIYTPENFSQNDSTFSDTLAFSNRYIAPAISDGKCIGAFFISQYEGKWVIDTYIAGLDIEAAIQQHKDTALCFVSIPQFGVEEGFLTKTDTGEVYTSISATFDKISSGEELLNRLLEKNNQNNDEMTEG